MGSEIVTEMDRTGTLFLDSDPAGEETGQIQETEQYSAIIRATVV